MTYRTLLTAVPLAVLVTWLSALAQPPAARASSTICVAFPLPAACFFTSVFHRHVP